MELYDTVKGSDPILCWYRVILNRNSVHIMVLYTLNIFHASILLKACKESFCRNRKNDKNTKVWFFGRMWQYQKLLAVFQPFTKHKAQKYFLKFINSSVKILYWIWLKPIWCTSYELITYKFIPQTFIKYVYHPVQSRI